MFDASTRTAGGRIDFAAVNQVAIGNLDHLVADLLPGGRVAGREYCCSDLAGGHGNSLRVNLDSGKWADFATDQKGGDPISLVAAIKNCSQLEAARDLATTLGVTTGRLTPSPPKATWRTVPAPAPPAEIRHQKFGTPTNTWEYRGPAGELLGIVCRFDRPTPPGQKQRKEILPLTFGTDDPKRPPGWRWKSWPEPRPLHGLDRLATAPSDAPVMICEGEKATTAAQRLLPEYVAMTWPGGSNAVTKTDFRPIAGRSVTIWPDADDPGLKAATTVAEQLRHLSCEVRILPVPTGTAEGWDAADAEAEGLRPEILREVIRAAWAAGDQAEKKIKPLDVLRSLDAQPPPKEFHLRRYIPCGEVGLLVGTGGIGKSYMMLLMLMASASGKTIPPFEPPQPAKVLLLNVEDSADDLARRLHYVGQEYAFNSEERELLRRNLIVLPGRGHIGAMMRRDHAAGCPVETDHAIWLRQQIEQYSPDLVVLDTKARLYGLDENSTDDGSLWVAMLESMLVSRPKMTFLIVSHTAKHNAQSEDQHANRGASSVTDNTRFTLILCQPQNADMEGLEGADSSEFIKLVHPKASNSKKADPVFFRRNPHGVPVFEEVRNTRMESISTALDRLVLILREDYPDGLNRRALERGTEDPAKAVKREVMECSGLRNKSDWIEVLRLGVESTRLEAVNDSNSPSSNKPILVRVRCH